MTLAPPDRPTVFDAHAIDMRCAAEALLTPGAERPPGALRCQLLAGHGGEHALMYAGVQQRQVVRWSGVDTDLHTPEQDWHALSWMRGLPVPAWFETDTADTSS